MLKVFRFWKIQKKIIKFKDWDLYISDVKFSSLLKIKVLLILVFHSKSIIHNIFVLIFYFFRIFRWFNLLQVTPKSWFLSFGKFLFAFGGHSAFPNFQKDMKNPRNFPGSILIAFLIKLVLYIPLGVIGMLFFGDLLHANILHNINEDFQGEHTWIIKWYLVKSYNMCSWNINDWNNLYHTKKWGNNIGGQSNYKII